MDNLVLPVAGVLLLALIGLWVVVRRRDGGTASVSRTARTTRTRAAATTALRTRAPATEAAPVTDFGPTEPIGRSAIEVAEMAEVVDLEALLSSVPPRIAAETRDVLDVPTNIVTGPLPPPASGVTPPAAPPLSLSAEAAPPAPVTAPRRAPPPRPTLADLLAGTSLRDLALAWYQARGYRSSPVSSALAPIACVLRHREDPSRVYAVIEPTRQAVDEAVLDVWLARAQAVGVGRVLVLIDAAIDLQADARKGVRLLNRVRLEAELRRLDPRIAARIIGIVKARASGQTRTAEVG